MEEINYRKRGRPRAFSIGMDSRIVQSLDKALFVLKVVSEGAGLSLSEISNISETPVATTYRALITLQKHGMVAFDEISQLWSIDVEAFRIGSTFLAGTNIVEQARPVMQALMLETNETVNLGILSEGEVVFLSQVESHQTIRAFFRPGTRGSIHASGIGKTLFSFRTEKQATTLALSLDLVRFTEKTAISTDQLLKMREEAIHRGYAIDDEERTIGMRCIAAPIFNNFGEPTAAISISGPTVRIEVDAIRTIGKKVRNSADQITRNVGGKPRSFLTE
ncbi:MAG: IclR family transcriptional regulator [Blastopirellula sp.]|nr:MAG: IclR family transcriptional regulator [Blastopirellula sp.]